jgi:hypothetical protein
MKDGVLMIFHIYAKVSLSKTYQVEDAKDKMTIPDLFVVRIFSQN